MKAKVKKEMSMLDFLVEMIQTASKSKIRKMLKFGQITLDGKPARRGDVMLRPGQVVAIGQATHQDWRETAPTFIVHEDEHIIVANKPAGLLSISTDKEKKETMHALLFEYMQTKENGRVYLVHRLDRDVAGLMVFAKTSEVKAELQIGWEHSEKRYNALVEGKPPKPAGRIETWIEEESSFKMKVCDEHDKAKHAITEYKTLKEMKDATLLDIKLKTGRRHQIRAHLAHLGCPIHGDYVYGNAEGRGRLLLFSYLLRIRHPKTGRQVTYKLEVPKEYQMMPTQEGQSGRGTRRKSGGKRRR